jgi:drug/metabolite transporter (DMT)-like permease
MMPTRRVVELQGSPVDAPAPAVTRRPATARGTHPSAFGGVEWALVVVAALTWGSSFLLVAVAVRDLRPEVVALVRVVVASALVAVLPEARRRVARSDWPAVVGLGVVWVAVPLVLVPFALLQIESSLAAMVNSTAPLATALVAAVLLRERPRPLHLVGFLVALLGLVLLSWRSLDVGGGGAVLGIGLVVGAVACYAVGSNLAVPLQQEYGALPLLLRAQVVAAVVLVPFAGLAVPSSTWTLGSTLAAAGAGALSSGVAFLAVMVLLGRVGAPRGSMTLYVVPLVATVLGVWLLDEVLGVRSLLGLLLILGGAALVSRGEVRP